MKKKKIVAWSMAGLLTLIAVPGMSVEAACNGTGTVCAVASVTNCGTSCVTAQGEHDSASGGTGDLNGQTNLLLPLSDACVIPIGGGCNTLDQELTVGTTCVSITVKTTPGLGTPVSDTDSNC